jgi:hypothetical protein
MFNATEGVNFQSSSKSQQKQKTVTATDELDKEHCIVNSFNFMTGDNSTHTPPHLKVEMYA